LIVAATRLFNQQKSRLAIAAAFLASCRKLGRYYEDLLRRESS
jgi:hypothetical protein